MLKRVCEEITKDCQKTADVSKLSGNILKHAEFFSSTQISIILNSLARGNSRNSEILFSLTRAAENFPKFSAFEIGLIVNSLAKLKFKNERLIDNLLRQSRRNFQVSRDITPQTLCLTFAGLISLGREDSRLISSTLSRVERNFQDFNPADCASLLHALSNLEKFPGPLFEKLAIRAGKGQKENVLLALSSLARNLEISNISVIQDLLQKIDGFIPELNLGQLANTAEAVSLVFQKFPGYSLPEKIASEVIQKLKKEKIQDSSVVLLFSAFSRFKSLRWVPLFLELLPFAGNLNFAGAAVVLNALSRQNIDKTDFYNFQVYEDLTSQSVSLVLAGLARSGNFSEVSKFACKAFASPSVLRGMTEQGLCNSALALALNLEISSSGRSEFLAVIGRLVQLKILGSSVEAKTQLQIAALVLAMDLEISSPEISKWVTDVLTSDVVYDEIQPSDLHLEISSFIGKFKKIENEARVGPYSLDILVIE